MRTGMIYTDLTKNALKICYRAHRGQEDAGGIPYVFHPLHLAEQMSGEYEVCVALLHDVVEDTSVSLMDLKEAGFPEEVVEAVDVLTHDRSVPYMEYVLNIRKNDLARKVKLADLEHNTDYSRLNVIGPSERTRNRKYRIARALLESPSERDPQGRPGRCLPLGDEENYGLFLYYRDPEKAGAPGKDQDQRLLYGILAKEGRALMRLDLENKDFYPGSTKLSLPEEMAEYLAGHEAGELPSVLDRYGIGYQLLET